MRCRHKIAGQSLVELVVGLLAVVLVLMGLLQVGRLGLERTQTMMDGREAVDEVVMDSSFEPLDPGAAYGWGVADGPDRRSYSQDDLLLHGSPELIIEDVVEHATPEALAIWAGETAITPLEYQEDFMQAFDLSYEQSSSGIIELYPIIRNLVTDDERIIIRRRVWMPWLRGVE
jgi:hypothetical protein